MAAITGVMVAPLIVFIFSLIATCVDHVDKSEEEIREWTQDKYILVLENE